MGITKNRELGISTTGQAPITKVCGARTFIMAIGLVAKRPKRPLRINLLNMSPAQRVSGQAARSWTLGVGSAAAVFTWLKNTARKPPGLRFLQYKWKWHGRRRRPKA